MELVEIVKDVYHLKFNSQLELTSTFLRFQEHYESPEFRGKVFTLDEYKKWYIANSEGGKDTGKFTYYEDWSGFNVPSFVLEQFFLGDFNPLDEKEQAFLKLFDDKKGSKFYVIGTYAGKGEESLKHELAHGLFYTNSDYRSEVLALLGIVDLVVRNQINDYLAKEGYHSSVFEDETHAYLLEAVSYLKEIGININDIKEVNVGLNEIFEKYTKKEK